jgi:hypothetical protein
VSSLVFSSSFVDLSVPWALINGFFDFFLRIEDYIFSVEPQFQGKVMMIADTNLFLSFYLSL